LTKTKPDQPKRSERHSGGARHDARGHAVWQWAADTARNLAISTSQVLRRLDHHGLSLQDETPPARGKVPDRPKGSVPSGSVTGAGFNPYEGRPAPRATRSTNAARSTAAAP